MEFGIAGINIMLLVLGVVEAAKRLGVKGNGSFILALVLGFAFGVLSYLAENAVIPEAVMIWVSAGVFGAAFGLAATGLYDFSKKFQE